MAGFHNNVYPIKLNKEQVDFDFQQFLKWKATKEAVRGTHELHVTLRPSLQLNSSISSKLQHKVVSHNNKAYGPSFFVPKITHQQGLEKKQQQFSSTPPAPLVCSQCGETDHASVSCMKPPRGPKK